MHIPLPYLQALVVFEDSPNMTQAASRLGLTQSALSKQLGALERLLPQKTFAADGRKKVLTPYGRALSAELRENLEHLDRAVRRTGLGGLREEDVELRVGGEKELLARLGSGLGFRGLLRLREGDIERSLELLLANRLDAVLSPASPAARDAFGTKLLLKDQSRLLIPKKLMKEKPSFSEGLLKRLAGLPSLEDRTEDSLIARLYRHYGLSHRSPPRRVFSQWDLLVDWAERGLGWTVAPASRPFSERTLHALPVPAKALPPTTVFLAYRKELSASPWFKDFLRDAENAFKSR